MKKVSILFVSLFIAFAAFAQPQAGSFGVEINFDPFTGNNPVFSTDGLKVRYFISDKMAIRGTLGFDMNTEKEGIYDSDNKLYYTEKETTTVFSLTPGFEYHVATFEKVSVYCGAEIGFAVGSGKYTEKYEDSNNGTDEEYKAGIFGFGVGAFTGVDYYITKNLYIGAELGLGFQTLKATPNKSTTIGSTTDKDDSYISNSRFGFQATPAFRLGWTF